MEVSVSNDSFARDFIALVKKGQRAAAERMLMSDPSLVGATDEHGVSAILLAYYTGHADVAKTLLELKPRLDVFEASTVGDADRVRELLTKDPSLANAWSSDGFFPLGLAAFFKRNARFIATVQDEGGNFHLGQQIDHVDLAHFS